MSIWSRSAFVICACGVALQAQSGSGSGVPPIEILAPTVLKFPASVRALGMGDVGIASRDDDVIFYNPAQLAIARGMSASGSRYSPTAGGGALSSVTRFNNGGIGVGVSMLEYNALTPLLPGTAPSMQGHGGTASSIDAVIGLAQVYKSVRVGVAAKYVDDQLPDMRINQAAFDVGLAKDFRRFYTVGLAVQNIGGSTTYPCPTCTIALSNVSPSVPLSVRAKLPLRATLGAATSRQLGPFDAVATFGLSMLRSDVLHPVGGVELAYSWLDGYNIAVRAGSASPSVGESSATGGVGFTMDRLTIDYGAEASWSGRGVQHRIGLRIR
jgi:hypothetical protein